MQRGLAVSGAGCAACHAPPEFDIDPNSLNNGVITKIGGGTDLTNTRSPSLRDLIRPGGLSNGPFMHDGNFATLAQIINHYNAIPGDNTNLDTRLRRPGGVQNLNLTQQQRNDLAPSCSRSPAAMLTPMKSGPILSTRKTSSRSSSLRPTR